MLRQWVTSHWHWVAPGHSCRALGMSSILGVGVSRKTEAGGGPSSHLKTLGLFTWYLKGLTRSC